jgi:cytochrome c-type biogenesis protein CcmH
MRRRDLYLLLGTALPAAANMANDDPRLEKLYSTYIAPCCWRENLMVHHSPKADELRASIAAAVKAGKTDDEIRASLIGEYTVRILALPEGAKGQWLWWTPVAATAGGFAALALALRKMKRKEPVAAEATPSDLPELPETEWSHR